MTTRRERRERRSLARREWANKRNAKADDALDRAEKAVEGIPPGQPILVGHHSEATHRRALDRHDSAMRKGREHAAMALKHDSAADALENELSRSVYSDDPDAAERLKERIDGLLAKRAWMHQVNRQFRKTGSLEGLDITEEERQDLVNAARFSGSQGLPVIRI